MTEHKEAIAAVVILFNPQECILDNIKSYLSSMATLYIIDNSTQPHNLLKKLSSYSKVTLIHSGENIGIAKALNLALKHAENDGYQWLMTMDQDTSFEAAQLDIYLKDFYQLDKKRVGVVSPLHNKKLQSKILQPPFISKAFVMTSANIINVDAARDIEGFDEKLFIDEVDHAFCFALGEKYYQILQHGVAYVNHSLGEKHQKFHSIKLYPASRLYYMIRNYLYLKKRFQQIHPRFFKTRTRYLLKFFMLQLLFNGEPVKSIQMLSRGVLDYKKERFGKQI